MCVGGEHRCVVVEKGKWVDAYALHRVDDVALKITHVELSTITAGDEALTIRWECGACQRVIVRLRLIEHFCVELQLVDIEDEQLRGAFFSTTDEQIAWVGRPFDKGDAVGMTVERFQLFELMSFRIDVPNDAERVLGAGGELETVGWEFAVPNFVGMLVEHLKKDLRC